MSVKVAVRVRPFNSRETKLGCECVVDMQGPATTLKASKTEAEKKFTFDFSLWSFDQYEEQPDGYLKPTNSKYADQKYVFEKIGKSILDNAWQGYHCCLFAYGQTGSGKSYSMIGYGVNKGIVPITCNQIFERMKNKQADVEYQVHASMLEIYNQEIQDLTIPINKRPPKGLSVRENKLLGVYVEGVAKHRVTNYDQIQDVMEQGTKNRTVAATQMNATSSRAHTIITVQFKQIKKVGEAKSEKISMINLVDLAGSQRQDKTGATGQRLKEAVGINQSLTSLGQVISALAENADGANNFIPYRNSALTRILQNALGGNSQTIMICAISPANDNYDQSLSTLRYADRAKKIKNKPVVNQSATDKMIRDLKQENQRLKQLLEGKGIKEGGGGGGQVSIINDEQMKKKEEQIKKREQQLKQKQAKQSQKLKALEAELLKKEQERKKIQEQKIKEISRLEKQLKDEEIDDLEREKVIKQLQVKKKEEEESKKKLLQQQKSLELQQVEQRKKLEEQAAALKKNQDQYMKFMEETKKREDNLIKQKQKQLQKKEEEMKQKEKQQIQSLKKLQDQLQKKEAEKQKLVDDKSKQIASLQKKLKDGELDDLARENVIKELQTKKKEDEEIKKKMDEQRQNIEKQQAEQKKILEVQHQILKKNQDEFKKMREQHEKNEEERKKQNKKGKQSEQEIKSNLAELQKMIKELKMSEQQKKKQLEEEKKKKQQNSKQNPGILTANQLLKMKQKQGKLPPYFENISKDVMIHRKIKILIDKDVMTVGKVGCNPPNDIVFGGRDVNMKHAVVKKIGQKVFLEPMNNHSHLYVNGERVVKTIELKDLDRVIFGWNSCYLFKHKHDGKTDEKIKDRSITWEFMGNQVQHLVDIDQSDTEDGGGCCRIF